VTVVLNQGRATSLLPARGAYEGTEKEETPLNLEDAAAPWQ